MKRKGIIFAQLQFFKKSKYPDFLKKILIETAFDTAAALRTIKKSIIEEIEIFVNQRTDLSDLLKDTSYIDETGNLKKTPFKFMLGHESLLLRLPNDVEEYLSKKEVRKSEIPAIEDIKLLLIEKINNFARDKNIELTLSSEDISKFTKSNNCVKCEANCPFCSRKICCSFYSSWKLSNYNKHIISCAKKAARPNSRPNPQIERATPAVVLQELQNALP